MFDPANDGLVVRRIFFKTGASLMGDFASRFEDQERMFWSSLKNTAAPGIANKIVMVVPRFVTEEGEFKAILSGGFSVAPSSVAAVL